jgi:hypothetical protein
VINSIDLTQEQVRRINAIKKQIESLQGQIESISGGGREGAGIERSVGRMGPSTVRASNWTYSFWESPSSEEYARRQGVEPITDVASLYGSGEPEDWQGFDEAVERWHAENSVT